MLDIQNITFTYGRGCNVLNDFSFSIDAGGVYGLLGKNGSGKSTLLYLIAGLLTPAHGEVRLDGVNTRRRLPSTLSEIFIVPEEFDLPPVSLDRYVELYAGLYPRFDREAMHRYLKIFDLSGDLMLNALSMGQKKKAFMSFAMACNTRVLLMDEPSNGLDIPGKSAFRRAISAAASDDRIIIISTHQVRDIDRILDHILILDNSRVVLDSRVGDILARLKFFHTNDPAVIGDALCSIPGVEGTAVVVPNTDGDETELNLETLFALALSNPGALAAAFADGPDAQLPPPLPTSDDDNLPNA